MIDEADEPGRNDGRAFEAECEAVCVGAGWRVGRTAVVGDFGVDLVASRGRVKIAIQCKDWTTAVPCLPIVRSSSQDTPTLRDLLARSLRRSGLSY